MNPRHLTFVPERAKPRWALRIACSIAFFVALQFLYGPLVHWFEVARNAQEVRSGGRFTIVEE